MAAALRRGDIVTIHMQQDQAAGPAPDADITGSEVPGLVKIPAIAAGRATVWTPFACWLDQTQFQVPRAGLSVTVVSHVRLLDGWTVSVKIEQQPEQTFTVPLLFSVEEPQRLRVAFLTWYFELGPGRGLDYGVDVALALSEF